ncbi:MAG: hypothetical protein C4K58_03075 [Flavobacteriaceae bacterium]|nr:MAG: hypothetical protein C4K58_03075 [Flavobacteriaceae bacterium]
METSQLNQSQEPRILDFSNDLILQSKKIPLLNPSEFETKVWAFVREFLEENPYIELKTSGSTGEPKTILAEKEKLKISAQRTLDFLDLNPKNQKSTHPDLFFALVLPIEYIAGKMMVIRALVAGAKLLVIEPKTQICFPIGCPKIALLALTPMQLSQSLEGFPEVSHVLLGGAKLNENLQEQIHTTFEKKRENNKNLPTFWETFGMTETFSHIALKQVFLKKNAFFEVFDSVEIFQDESGCLGLKDKALGLHLKTEDLVEVLSAKTFVWKGRKGNVINSAGVKIFPESIENILEAKLGFPFFVHGIPDDVMGQKVSLFLEVGENLSDLEKENIKTKTLQTLENLKDSLGKFQKPKAIFLLKTFERTLSGKIQRDKTVKEFLELM